MPLRPTKWLIRLLILWAVVAVLAAWWDKAGEIWLIAGACLGALFLSDAILACFVKEPRLQCSSQSAQEDVSRPLVF